jgi:hypothetical protein
MIAQAWAVVGNVSALPIYGVQPFFMRLWMVDRATPNCFARAVTFSAVGIGVGGVELAVVSVSAIGDAPFVSGG